MTFKPITQEVQEELRRTANLTAGEMHADSTMPHYSEVMPQFRDAPPDDPLTQEIEAMRDICLYLDALSPQAARRVLQFCISRTSERLDKEATKWDDLP